MMETRKGNNDGHYLRFFRALLSDRRSYCCRRRKRTPMIPFRSMTHREFPSNRRDRLSFFFLIHCPGSPVPSAFTPLYSECEKRGIKRETTRKGRQAKYYFLFSESTLFPKGTRIDKSRDKQSSDR